MYCNEHFCCQYYNEPAFECCMHLFSLTTILRFIHSPNTGCLWFARLRANAAGAGAKGSPEHNSQLCGQRRIIRWSRYIFFSFVFILGKFTDHCNLTHLIHLILNNINCTGSASTGEEHSEALFMSALSLSVQVAASVEGVEALLQCHILARLHSLNCFVTPPPLQVLHYSVHDM